MERRREKRFNVELPATFRLKDAEARNAFFSQISANGCRLVIGSQELAAGDIVELFLGPIGPCMATVRWSRDRMAGVEFEAALDAAVVSYFAAFTSDAA